MSSKPPFFSRRIKIFGNVSVLILCVIFFMIPFAFRGARMALREMRNEVSDWLPRDFPETKELDWFRQHFIGSQFVVISWDGCTAEDQRFKALVAKFKQDSQATEFTGPAARAKEIGDTYGLHLTESTYEDWGSGGEKWLAADNEQWFYVTPEGGVYRWTGSQNIVGFVGRQLERLFTGSNRVNGELIYQFTGDFAAELYRNPRRLNSRLFKQVLTGPDVFNELAGPTGSLIRGEYNPRDPQTLAAQIEAHQRLTGVFFGPTPRPGFDWTADAFWDQLPETTREQLPDAWRAFFDEYVTGVISDRYDGDREKLLLATGADQLEHWYRLFYQLQVEPPPRQTCIVSALSDIASRDLSRVVGRPDFFKPTGRVYLLAAESGVPPSEAHLGGPPVDNVAIDEEGTITLFKLISLSTIIGITLAYLSFRSINVTLMIFFIGGVSAVMSVGFVWFGGSSLDAVLLSMPSLVYVLGLSGAVHIVNYYREACHASGPKGACETAIRHGWFPCTIAALTTALGLVSLYASNLIPIKKFGLFSAIGTMATVILLFTYLPSALTLWPPGYKRDEDTDHDPTSLTLVHRFWDYVGGWIVRHYALVCSLTLLLMVTAAMGIPKIRTSVQLLKLFDSQAKVITDYQWLETHLGRLVPMEIVLAVEPSRMRESETTSGQGFEPPELVREKQLTFLERMELSGNVRRAIEAEFGDRGRGIIGPGMSSDVMILPGELPAYDVGVDRTRAVYNSTLLDYRPDLQKQLDFFRTDQQDARELWRISLRLGAFNNVDYGRFVADLKQVVEPVLAAYRARDSILTSIYQVANSPAHPEMSPEDASILLLGWQPERPEHAASLSRMETHPESQPAGNTEISGTIPQSEIFCKNLRDVLENRGFSFEGRRRGRRAYALDYENEQHQKLLDDPELLREQLARIASVVIVTPPPQEIEALLDEAGVATVDVSNHLLEVDPSTKETLQLTASERRLQGDNPAENFVTAVYTGIVPIVYKAQRTLLSSLIDSICLAFAMIAVVMMILLRDWKQRFTLANSLNVGGGLVSMLPNLFPVILIFGLMGHLGIEVDIGSMMTASVALGVAVDDTIHFLSWFRMGMRQGLSRQASIRTAYARVATAMTQTTLIGGLGLSAFAFSTFTPTQRFGVLMLTLLFAALLGDLIFLPALLASPFGRLFRVKPQDGADPPKLEPASHWGDPQSAAAEQPSPEPSSEAVGSMSSGDGGERRSDSPGRPHVTASERVAKRRRADAGHRRDGDGETSG